jgi:hypothetical protein
MRAQVEEVLQVVVKVAVEMSHVAQLVDVIRSSAGFPRLTNTSQAIVRIIKDVIVVRDDDYLCYYQYHYLSRHLCQWRYLYIPEPNLIHVLAERHAQDAARAQRHRHGPREGPQLRERGQGQRVHQCVSYCLQYLHLYPQLTVWQLSSWRRSCL